MDDFWTEFFAFVNDLSPFTRFCILALIIFAVVSMVSPYFALNSLRGIEGELERIRKELERRRDHDA